MRCVDMDYEELTRSFEEHLISKDIRIVDYFDEKYLNDTQSVKEANIINQLYAINEFHKRALGYKGYGVSRLDNKTGRVVEQYKVNIKRTKRYFKNLKESSPVNLFEEFLVQTGDYYIEKAEESIREIFRSGYMDILARSMKQIEVCLGNTDFSNLRKRDKLEVVNISECCYNTVEMDALNFLIKLRRKDQSLDFNYLAEKFCEIEGLDNNSTKVLNALMAYPAGFMKYCNRYRERKKEWSPEEYLDRLRKAVNKEGDFSL